MAGPSTPVPTGNAGTFGTPPGPSAVPSFPTGPLSGAPPTPDPVAPPPSPVSSPHAPPSTPLPPDRAQQVDPQLTNKLLPDDLSSTWRRTKCLNCGYVHEGTTVLTTCPKCGNTDPDRFDDPANL
ncbi:MAG: hypothetical protein PHG63_00140 [Candidatus Dojkabacteria bacterium]|nr:hypothetical protein [Candidatus Dojkabacteria bacterium]